MVNDNANLAKIKFSMAKVMFEHYFETVHVRTRLWEPQNSKKVKIFLTDYADFREKRLKRKADQMQRLADDQRAADDLQRYHDETRHETIGTQQSNMIVTNSYNSSTPSISIRPATLTSVHDPSINITVQDASMYNTFHDPSMHNVAQHPSMLSVAEDPSMLNANSYQSFSYPSDITKDFDNLKSFGFQPSYTFTNPENNDEPITTLTTSVENQITPPRSLSQIPRLVPRKSKSSDDMKQKRREAQNAAKEAAKFDAQDNENIDQIHHEISTLTPKVIDVNGIVITSPTNDIVPGLYTVMRVLRTSPKRRQISFEE